MIDGDLFRQQAAGVVVISVESSGRHTRLFISVSYTLHVMLFCVSKGNDTQS